MKRSKKIFVVDSNWYLWRAYHTTNSSRPINDVLPYNLLSMICRDSVELQADYVLCAFDGPKNFRKKLNPHYKANRDGKVGNGDEYGEQEEGTNIKAQVYGALPHIYDLFARVGLPFYTPRQHEADDVLKSVALANYKKYRVVCGTEDKDAYQYLISDRIRLYDSSAKSKDGKRKPKFIDREAAEKKKGVTVEQMVDFQTLIGDKGDNVFPIKDMTPGRAKKILSQYGSVRNWVKTCKEDRMYITQHLEHLRMNRQMVLLREDALPPGDVEEWKLLKEKPADKFLSRNFHTLHELMWPRTRGLFR
jgi:DNA polymerase I